MVGEVPKMCHCAQGLTASLHSTGASQGGSRGRTRSQQTVVRVAQQLQLPTLHRPTQHTHGGGGGGAWGMGVSILMSRERLPVCKGFGVDGDWHRLTDGHAHRSTRSTPTPDSKGYLFRKTLFSASSKSPNRSTSSATSPHPHQPDTSPAPDRVPPLPV